MSFDHEAARWEARVKSVLVGVIPRAEAEGAVAYARRHAEMYRDLKAHGEIRWNEEKLRRGKKKTRYIPRGMAALEPEAATEREQDAEVEWLDVEDNDNGDGDGDLLGQEGEDDEDAFGHLESDDEAFILDE